MNNQKFVAGCKAVSDADASRALLRDRGNAPLLSRLRHRSFTGRCVLLLAFLASMTVFGLAAPAHSSHRLAVTPPMGWNDWAHYQCGFTAQTVLDNANALVRTGLAAAGYKTVIIDDCWMQKGRDSKGNLQADPQRFPDGMKPIGEAIHKLGLNFGIYEDAGYLTCDGYAGSGEVNGGGRTYFDQDARLFASWGVDYLKLDGCRMYVPPGSSQEAAYRKAYAEESSALKKVNRPIVFSESAPAYFQGHPKWYSVLRWIGGYGQLWREGSDIANFHTNDPDHPRFPSVVWNYTYNLQLGRFQKPGNWDDADFIIGGDHGLSLAETHSQLALWSMMSAPLILSSDVGKLSTQAIVILGNKSVIAVDQDPLGRMVSLVSRSADMDILFKTLRGGDYAVAVLNRGDLPVQVDLHPDELGFTKNANCRFASQDLWSGARQPAASALAATVASHDTAIWRIHPAADCGMPTRLGAITMSDSEISRPTAHYTRCLASSGELEECAGTPAEVWRITRSGALQSSGRCLEVESGKPSMAACHASPAQHWQYTVLGDLVNDSDHQCLSSGDVQDPSLKMESCGPDKLEQIWSLPN
ncbi:MAG: ricin-type beta-trefoil lectin domain protein [Acidobacteriaceae bacterium]